MEEYLGKEGSITIFLKFRELTKEHRRLAEIDPAFFFQRRMLIFGDAHQPLVFLV